MLWTAQLRNTATQLIATALQQSGANVQSDRVIPAPAQSDGGVTIGLFVDDDMEGDYGGVPEFLSRATLTIEITAEAAVSASPLPPQSAAQALRDTVTETIKNALLGGQGFQLACGVTFGSKAITLPEDAPKIVPGFKIMGNGAGQDNFVETVNDDGTVTAAKPICLKNQTAGTATLQLTFGSFVALYERIDRVRTYNDDGAVDKKNYTFGATIEIVGHTHERFDPCVALDLNGVNIYVDTVNFFDPTGVYTGDEGPFAGTPAPRTTGPDGRPEITAQVTIPQD